MLVLNLFGWCVAILIIAALLLAIQTYFMDDDVRKNIALTAIVVGVLFLLGFIIAYDVHLILRYFS